MTPTAAVFDVMGTLFDLAPLRARFARAGAPELALDVWFARTLHGATSLTLAGEFAPFGEIARSTLASTLARLDLDPADADQLAAALGDLEPFPDAEPALARISAAGVRIWTLTNGDAEHTRGLLERGGLLPYVEEIATVSEVERYKPHGDVYRRALERLELAPHEACLVAAHAWDTVGARAAGMRAIWVDRLERVWPLPVPETERAASLEEAAAILFAS